MKKQKKSPPKQKSKAENVLDEIINIGNDLKSLAVAAKEKFDKADDKTKKKIMAGLASVGALLVAAAGVKKIKKMRRK
jgi:hypothetical protein